MWSSFMMHRRIAIFGTLFAACALAGCNSEDNGPMIENPKTGPETQADVQDPFGVGQKTRTKSAKNQPKDIR